jgi:hypothetical protein
MATDRDLLKTAEKGRLGSTSIANVATAVEATHRRVVTWHNITLESNAAANGTEYHIARFPRACKLVSAYETEHANVSADASNFLTLTLSKRTAGGAATSVATLVSNVAQTLLTPTAFTNNSNATVLELAAGDSLTIKTTKTGNGRAFIAYAQLTVDIEEI